MLTSPQMPTVVETGVGQSKEPESQSYFLTLVAETRILEPSSALPTVFISRKLELEVDVELSIRVL